jgi:hypothetical protein
VIGALGSPLWPHLKSDIATDLYSDSTSIAIIDEFDRRISFNLLNKYAISLSTAIGASDSPLEPHPERDLAIDLHSISTPITIKMSLIVRSDLDDFNKSITSLQEVIKAGSSPPGTPMKIDLAIDLYSGSALAAHYDEMGTSDSNDLFRSLNT